MGARPKPFSRTRQYRGGGDRLRSSVPEQTWIRSGGSVVIADPPALNGASNHPAYKLAKAISNALDPTRASGRVKTFAEMTPEEREKMRALYEKPTKK